MKPRLLIADRDAELCEVFRRFLTERGYEVETSTDGLDCLAKLRQVTPAVLVLDLELFWSGGDGVLAWLREERSASKIPVLLTATAAAPRDMAELHEPPVVGLPAQALRTDRSAGKRPLCCHKKWTKGAVEPESGSSLL